MSAPTESITNCDENPQLTFRTQSDISPLLVLRFAAVDEHFGNTGIPGGRPRAEGAHRKQPARRRARSTGFDRGLDASELNRRHFLGALAAATVAGVGVARLVVDPQPRTFAQAPAAGAAASGPTAPAAALSAGPLSSRIPLPGGGALTKLPGQGNLLALTLDDGVNSEVVRAYIQLAKDTGARMTFFVNGIYNSWTEIAPALRPLVDSGQIQLGNHTWSHPDLTTVPQSKVAQELTRNDEFLKKTYGIGAKPYFRPP